jgi:hypothetical protein
MSSSTSASTSASASASAPAKPPRVKWSKEATDALIQERKERNNVNILI